MRTHGRFKTISSPNCIHRERINSVLPLLLVTTVTVSFNDNVNSNNKSNAKRGSAIFSLYVTGV